MLVKLLRDKEVRGLIRYFYSKIRKDGHSNKILIPAKLLNIVNMKHDDEVEIMSVREGEFTIKLIKK